MRWEFQQDAHRFAVDVRPCFISNDMDLVISAAVVGAGAKNTVLNAELGIRFRCSPDPKYSKRPWSRINHMEPKTSVKEFKLANDRLSGAVGRRVPVINDPTRTGKLRDRSMTTHFVPL